MQIRDKLNQNKLKITFPLLLITLGVVVLATTTGPNKPNIWIVIFNIWPLLLIFTGILGLINRKNAGVFTFLITFGLALFLSNFDRISWTAWEIFFTFWPVLLLSIGIDLAFNQKTNWQLLIAGLLVISIMGTVALLFDSGAVSKSLEKIYIQQPRNDATSGIIHLRPSMSVLNLVSQGSSELLVDGIIKLWNGETTTTSYELQNGMGSYVLESSGMVFLYEPGVKNRAEWEIGVTSRIPVEIVIDQTIGEQHLDLSSLTIGNFTSELRIGNLFINLPSEINFEGTIKLSVGEIMIDVPEGAVLRLIGRPVFGDINYPENFQQQDNYIESVGFNDSENQMILLIDQKVGQVTIRQR